MAWLGQNITMQYWHHLPTRWLYLPHQGHSRVHGKGITFWVLVSSKDINRSGQLWIFIMTTICDQPFTWDMIQSSFNRALRKSEASCHLSLVPWTRNLSLYNYEMGLGYEKPGVWECCGRRGTSGLDIFTCLWHWNKNKPGKKIIFYQSIFERSWCIYFKITKHTCTVFIAYTVVEGYWISTNETHWCLPGSEGVMNAMAIGVPRRKMPSAYIPVSVPLMTASVQNMVGKIARLTIHIIHSIFGVFPGGHRRQEMQRWQNIKR